MQIEIKPFTLKRWHVAGVGMGVFAFGMSLINQLPIALMVIGGLLVAGAAISWLNENG